MEKNIFMELWLREEDFIKIDKVNTEWQRWKKIFRYMKSKDWKKFRNRRKIKYYEYYANQIMMANTKQIKETEELLSDIKFNYYNSHILSMRLEIENNGEKKWYVVWYVPAWYMVEKLANLWFIIYHPKKRRIPQNLYRWFLDEVENLKYFNVHNRVIDRIKNIKEKYGRAVELVVLVLVELAVALRLAVEKIKV